MMGEVGRCVIDVVKARGREIRRIFHRAECLHGSACYGRDSGQDSRKKDKGDFIAGYFLVVNSFKILDNRMRVCCF